MFRSGLEPTDAAYAFYPYFRQLFVVGFFCQQDASIRAVVDIDDGVGIVEMIINIEIIGILECRKDGLKIR